MDCLESGGEAEGATEQEDNTEDPTEEDYPQGPSSMRATAHDAPYLAMTLQEEREKVLR